MVYAIDMVKTLLAILIHLDKKKRNEKAWKYKIGTSWTEFKNLHVAQFIKLSTIWYIKCVCPIFWVSKV
jgi:hypothetical protein